MFVGSILVPEMRRNLPRAVNNYLLTASCHLKISISLAKFTSQSKLIKFFYTKAQFCSKLIWTLFIGPTKGKAGYITLICTNVSSAYHLKDLKSSTTRSLLQNIIQRVWEIICTHCISFRHKIMFQVGVKTKRKTIFSNNS